MGTRKLVCALLLLTQAAGAQWRESFADGNFTAAPAWTGDAAAFSVAADSDAGPGAAGAQVLRLSAPSGSGLKTLSVPVPGSWGVAQEWGFHIGRRAQAATASNVSYVWLWIDEGTVTPASGYRVRFGDDSGGDEVVLECVQSGNVKTIISSSGSVPNGLTDYGISVRVTRAPGGTWTIYTSPLPTVSGGGPPAGSEGALATVMQGNGQEATFTGFDNGRIAVAATHTTTAAARAGLEIDDLYLQTSGGAALPVRFRSFRAERTAAGLRLLASVEEAESTVAFHLQRSSNGRQFLDWQFPQVRLREGGMEVEGLDRERHPGKVYYRVRAVEDSLSTYSDVIMVAEAAAPGMLFIWPNPVRRGVQRLLISGTGGSGTLYLYNAAGFPVASRYFASSGTAVAWTVTLLNTGIYRLRWMGPQPGNASLLVY